MYCSNFTGEPKFNLSRDFMKKENYGLTFKFCALINLLLFYFWLNCQYYCINCKIIHYKDVINIFHNNWIKSSCIVSKCHCQLSEVTL